MRDLTKKTALYLIASMGTAAVFAFNGSIYFAVSVFAFVSSFLLIPYWLKISDENTLTKLAKTLLLICANTALLCLANGVSRELYVYILSVAALTTASIFLGRIMPAKTQQ